MYGTPRVEMNYDARMLGGNSGLGGDLLPKVVGAPEQLRWTWLDRDPNHFVPEPEV